MLGLIASSRLDRELDDELASHLQLHADDNVRHGMRREEADRRARIALGGVEQTKELYRDRRSFVSVEHLAYDIRLAMRT